jgi:hypothetical protein
VSVIDTARFASEPFEEQFAKLLVAAQDGEHLEIDPNWIFEASDERFVDMFDVWFQYAAEARAVSSKLVYVK